nr:site-specific integrase [Telluria antibiotica]
MVLANEKLVVSGRTYEGFPLLLDDKSDAIQPAQRFLWELLLSPGKRNSKDTWAAYGRSLYDYFAFLSANNLDWTANPALGSAGPLVKYRDWSRGELELSPRTVNQRMRIVVRFYVWALETRLIETLPFDKSTIRLNPDPGFASHLNSGDVLTQTPDVLLREPGLSIPFITKEQAKDCLQNISNYTHQLIFQLMLRTGLRQVECRTFPEKYVFDPTRRKDLSIGQKIRISLNPRDMRIKFNKPRDIDIPYDLMEDLFWYASRHRQKRENNVSDDSKFATLFLTETGRPYGKTAFTDIFSRLTSRVNYKVRPHMLRHTYATYLLWSLRKSKDFKGEPLLYVRDRLGHSSVKTTAKYLHLINNLEGHLILQHEDELDKLFSSED